MALTLLSCDDATMLHQTRCRGLTRSATNTTAAIFRGIWKKRLQPSTVTVLQGTISHGQGHETIFKQIICDRLGIDPSIIRYVQGDTDLVTYGRGTFNSRSTSIAGSAAVRACDKIIDKAKSISAHILEASEADIEYSDGVFTVGGTDRAINLIEVAMNGKSRSQNPCTCHLAATSI